MPKQCSTRSAPAKRRSARKKAVTPDSTIKNTDLNLPQQEDASKYAEQARRLVLAAWPEIVHGLIKKAVSGGYQQTKLLLELSDLENSDAASVNEQRRQQLCDALLEGLGWSSGNPDDHVAKGEVGLEDPESNQKKVGCR